MYQERLSKDLGLISSLFRRFFNWDMSPLLFPTTIHESLFALFVSCDLAMTVWKALRLSCALFRGARPGATMEMVRVRIGITV